MKGVSFRLFQTFLRLAAGIWDRIIINRPGLVDRSLLLLLRLVYLVESSLHHRRRPHCGKLDLLNLKAKFVVGTKLSQAFERGRFNIVASNGKHFVHGAITDRSEERRVGKEGGWSVVRADHI